MSIQESFLFKHYMPLSYLQMFMAITIVIYIFSWTSKISVVFQSEDFKISMSKVSSENQGDILIVAPFTIKMQILFLQHTMAQNINNHS